MAREAIPGGPPARWRGTGYRYRHTATHLGPPHAS